MEYDKILQDSGSFLFIKSQDLLNLAEVLLTLSKPKQEAVEFDNPMAPISQSDVMKRFNVTRQTVLRWRKKGILKGFLIGGRIYFRPNEVDALLKIQR